MREKREERKRKKRKWKRGKRKEVREAERHKAAVRLVGGKGWRWEEVEGKAERKEGEADTEDGLGGERGGSRGEVGEGKEEVEGAERKKRWGCVKREKRRGRLRDVKRRFGWQGKKGGGSLCKQGRGISERALRFPIKSSIISVR